MYTQYWPLYQIDDRSMCLAVAANTDGRTDRRHAECVRLNLVSLAKNYIKSHRKTKRLTFNDRSFHPGK